MTLKQINYFLAIAETGQITAAARRLNISQPPLSYQLKMLEEELGVQLFIRDGRSMVITKAGQLFLERASQLQAMYERTMRQMQDIGGESHPVTLHIGSITSVSNLILPQLIQKFLQLYPNVRFETWEGGSGRVMELIDGGMVDIALVRDPIDTTRYNKSPVYNPALGTAQADRFVAVGLAKFFEDVPLDTMPVSALKGKPIIVHRRFYDMIESACREKGFSMNVLCRNENIEASYGWASAGLGLAVAPQSASMMVRNEDLVVKPLSDPEISSPAYLIWDKTTILPDMTRKFISFFIAQSKLK